MKGFTLIEILLVIAIVLTVGFLSAAFPPRFIRQMAVRDAQDEFRSVLQKAQAYAISGRGHSSWGAHYSNSVITLFKGDSYDNRDQSFDENTNINEKVSISDFTEAVFVQPGGRPREAKPDVTLVWGSETASFSLNKEGAIE